MAAQAKTKTNGELKWVGKRPVRPDGADKVTGRAKFGADFHVPGMIVGKVLRSPHAHARIKSIDVSKAAALPGVKAIVTSDDFAEMPSEAHRGRRDVDQLPRPRPQHRRPRQGAL